MKKATTIRLEEDLMTDIETRAKALGISQNEWISRALLYALASKSAAYTLITKVEL